MNKLIEIADVVRAFELTCKDKYVQDGYIDISTIGFPNVTKDLALKVLKELDSKYYALYEGLNESFRDEEKAISYWKDRIGDIAKLNASMSLREARLIVSWVFKIYHQYYGVSSRSKKLAIDVFNYIFLWTEENNAVSYYNTSIIFNPYKVFPKKVKTVPEFLEAIISFNISSEKRLFYRGHSKLNYQVIPSIFRKDPSDGKRELLQREKQIYNEMLYRCSEVFKECKTHLEILTIMQHYGLPTRLLDITTNPLVALYFACSDESKDYGEVVILETDESAIKWANSDTISILASIPALSYDDKKSLAKIASKYNYDKSLYTDGIIPSSELIEDFILKIPTERLLGEIKTEKPGFESRINPGDILSRQFVFAAMNNQRIINQNGAFILFGESRINEKELDEYIVLPANELRYALKDGSNRKQLLIIENKNEILKQLKLVNVDRINLFPEIEDVASAMMSQ